MIISKTQKREDKRVIRVFVERERYVIIDQNEKYVVVDNFLTERAYEIIRTKYEKKDEECYAEEDSTARDAYLSERFMPKILSALKKKRIKNSRSCDFIIIRFRESHNKVDSDVEMWGRSGPLTANYESFTNPLMDFLIIRFNNKRLKIICEEFDKWLKLINKTKEG